MQATYEWKKKKENMSEHEIIMIWFMFFFLF